MNKTIFAYAQDYHMALDGSCSPSKIKISDRVSRWQSIQICVIFLSPDWAPLLIGQQ
jgi:hypothetical protein